MDLKRLNTETLSAQLNQWLPQLRWQIGRLGTPGKIGIGLLVVSGIYFFSAVAPQETMLQQLKERAETLQIQAQKPTTGDAEVGKKMTGDQALQAFYDFFPMIDSSPFWIRELVRIAKKHNVELSSSEYRLINEQDARLARYEMVLPIRGSYAQIRAFIADALESVPAIAISAIAIKRDVVSSDRLELRLEINLFLNK